MNINYSLTKTGLRTKQKNTKSLYTSHIKDVLWKRSDIYEEMPYALRGETALEDAHRQS